jgi:hypothetical protein
MAETIKSYEDLDVWQGGIQLCIQIYELVEHLPPSERFRTLVANAAQRGVGPVERRPRARATPA